MWGRPFPFAAQIMTVSKVKDVGPQIMAGSKVKDVRLAVREADCGHASATSHL